MAAKKTGSKKKTSAQRRTTTTKRRSDQGHSPILEFLEYVEGQQRNQSLKQLLDKVLAKSREMCRAEAGTIFIVRQRGKMGWLEPMSVQNDVIKVKNADFVVPIGPGTIAGYVAAAGEILHIDDVYEIPDNKPYSFNPHYEHKSYKTRSMLCFPLKNYHDEVTGVVQLINARKGNRKNPVPFDRASDDLIIPIARAAGHSIERADMLEQIKAKNRSLKDRNKRLQDQRSQIEELQEETEQAFQISVTLLARAAEIHDEETGNHIIRCNEYSYYVAKLMDMPDEWCNEIRYSAQLHDVGKMSVDAAVLKKKGRLDDGERAEMDRHTVYGYQILAESPRLKMGAEIALNHHEKWDGTGYPNGRRGTEIPLSARIVQIADIYDALRSKRPYKPAFTHEQSVKIITEGDDRIDPRGHFDPKIIELFADHNDGFDRIWTELMD